MADKVKEALSKIKDCIAAETKSFSDAEYAEVVKDLWLVSARLREEQAKVTLHKLTEAVREAR